FYDFIHPNPLGHALIAEAVYDGLFAAEQTPRAAKFWESRGIKRVKPEAVLRARLQLNTAEAEDRAIECEARAPYLGEEKGALIAEWSGGGSARLDNLTAEFSKFSLPLSDLSGAPPITDVVFRAEPLTAPQYPVGKTGVSSPVTLSVKSGGKDYGW